MSTIFVYVCNKCGESFDVEMEDDFAKIPFEGVWSCECGELIRVRWDGKELEYIKRKNLKKNGDNL
ncbi:Zn finger protein [Lokiarchaeota virus WyrdV1]|nr:Zn finger protein [Lokiarchaeota virus WyrdV1]